MSPTAYLLFLAILGFPILVCEFAVGRSSRSSCVRSFQALEPEGSRFHHFGPLGMAGNYLLMMFYTTVAGWMLHYFYLTASGAFTGAAGRKPWGMSSFSLPFSASTQH